MLTDAIIPARFLQPFALATILAVMFHLGTLVSPAQIRDAWRSPALMLKAIFCSVIAVPVIVVIVARTFDLPRSAQVGMALMAICPGAPVALRRALGAGGEASFAIAFQFTTAILAVVTVPAWVAALDELYAGTASVEPQHLALQVFMGQVLPLGLGVAMRGKFGPRMVAIQPWLVRLSTALLLAFVAVAVLDVWEPISGTRPHVALAIAVASLAALLTGLWLGGPAESTRTALGVACAARNTGLAMIVAILNHAPPAIMSTVIAYLAVSALVATPYITWRSRVASAAQNSSLP